MKLAKLIWRRAITIVAVLLLSSTILYSGILCLIAKQSLVRYRCPRRKYFRTPISYHSNTTSSFNISVSKAELLLSGDINPNPGPEGRRRKDGDSGRNSTTPVHEGDILKIPSHGIKLVSWNVQHLSNKLEEIKFILRTEEIDILCLQETFLSNLIDDNQLSVEKYNLFRRDRIQNAGGGILVFVHNRLEVKHHSNLEVPELELMWLTIKQKEYPSKFLCGFIYRPSPSTISSTDSKIISNIERAVLSSSDIWLSGDFNIDRITSCSYTSHKLIQALNDYDLKPLISGVTRPASNSCLDHIYITDE